MLSRVHAAALAAAILILGVITPASAQQFKRDWVVLGTQKVGLGIDRDTLTIGRSAGRFDKIKFRVKGNDVFFISVTIIYASGDKQDVPINRRLRRNSESEALDLNGGLRSIDRIEMVYGSRPNLGGQAEIEVLGERVEALPPPVSQNKWELLGTEVAGRGLEADVIQVGREAGRFHALRIRVLRNDLFLHDVEIVFSNGEREKLEVRQLIRAGQETAPITFNGRDRRINEIRLVHQSGARFQGRSLVEVYGEHAPERRPAEEKVPRDLVLLGTQTVGFTAERDVIRVGREAGAFEAIRLRVLDNDVFLRQIAVVYGNNERQELNLNAQIRAGDLSPTFKLGTPRQIRRVELVYNARPNFRGGARVELYGDPASLQAPDDWVLLGSEKANFSAEVDEVRVGEDKGRFSAVRLTIRDHAVEVFDVRVTYGNGEVQEFPVRRSFKGDEQSDALVFSRPHAIRSIAMRYRSKLNLQGPARVEVWARR